jgi:hypothetical protein
LLGFGKTALIRATSIHRGIRRISIHLEEMLTNPCLEFAIHGLKTKYKLNDATSTTNRNFYHYERHPPALKHKKYLQKRTSFFAVYVSCTVDYEPVEALQLCRVEGIVLNDE